VLRKEHMNLSLDFYTALGFEWTEEQHGTPGQRLGTAGRDSDPDGRAIELNETNWT